VLVHSLVRRFIKTAIAFLVLGLAIGTRTLIRREVYLRAPNPFEVSAHTHAILVGFVMMMILGVALWLFPRAERGEQRYDPRLAAAAYWLLTIGTAARVASELARASSAAPWLRLIVVAGGLAQFAGIVLFFFTMWPRIRSAGSHVREAKGEKF
jgi:cbb3-type cytochrome oxidase subunit 1